MNFKYHFMNFKNQGQEKINEKQFASEGIKWCLLLGQFSGGGNTMSSDNLNASSNIRGSSFPWMYDVVSIEGFVFTSISHGWKLLSIIKSSPNNSNTSPG